MNRAVVALALVAAFFLGARAQESTGALGHARDLIEAFNRHAPGAMTALVTDDVEVFYVDDQGAAGLGTRGAADLEKEMMAYFESHPTVRSEIVGAIDGPRFTAFRERVGVPGKPGRSAIAVYEVRDGLIARAWYFPAE